MAHVDSPTVESNLLANPLCAMLQVLLHTGFSESAT